MSDDDAVLSKVFAPRMLYGKVALVTGGGTGLGKSTAIELARCGAKVTIVGRRAWTLESATEQIRGTIGASSNGAGHTATGAGVDVAEGAGQADWAMGDVREEADARRLVETVLERRGRLDILVNNAGGQYFTPAEGIVAKGWSAVWRLNVQGMLNMSQAAVEQGLGVAAVPDMGVEGADLAETTIGETSVQGMSLRGTSVEAVGAEEAAVEEAGAMAVADTQAESRRARRAAERMSGGTIVNVTLSPHHGMPGMAHSGAARAVVEALTREMAERWADRQIAVTAVAAGHFDTEAMLKYPDTVTAGMQRSVPLQRLGQPPEHAWLTALLCSPVGQALNGSTVTLDGARDNWFGPWPPPGLTGETGEVPTEERRGLGPV